MKQQDHNTPSIIRKIGKTTYIASANNNKILLAIYSLLYYNSFQNDGVLKKGCIAPFIRDIVFLFCGKLFYLEGISK